VLSGLALLGIVSGARGQLTIQGVADRTSYTDSASFRVVTNVGFSYEVTLNGRPMPAGVTNTVGVMDYYDLAVRRTDTSTSAVTNALIRFIVLSSRRGSPERGLIEWFPLPPIPSTASEMTGAQLSLITPQDYPAGLDIPVVARVEGGAGNVRRVNGWVSAAGFESSAFRILRGVGHGFLPPAAAGSSLAFNGSLQSLQTNKQINIEASTTWTTVSGTLGTTTWPENSRIYVTGNLTIPAGVTLTVGAGTVVRLSPGVNITNTGSTIINGTTTQPVVFTSTNRVAPEQRTGAWGGFFMRGSTAQLIANGAIMTGSGAAASISFSPGSSHRSEQPLLFVHSGATVRMTNCALINLAGQVGNGYSANIVWDHCLIQRAITCGEYDGGTNIIRHSAVIEFPAVDGVYNATIADADYDGFYTINTTNYFEGSLFGFCKDDAMDSGSGGSGTVVVTNCWVESALHEAMAWSGEGRRTYSYDTVLMNSGQGLECGWSTGSDSPLVYGQRVLSTANSIGTRYGDNYEGTTGLGLKTGFLTVTNSYFLYNYRDVWGQVWDDTWNYRTNRMDVRGNYLTAANTNHPINSIWNPATHGVQLEPFMSTPTDAPVGIGLALWPEQLNVAALTNGVPVRLSSFTTHSVSVDFAVQSQSGTLTNVTLVFSPGETVKRIALPPAAVQGVEVVRIGLSNPVGGELTGTSASYLAAAQIGGELPSVHLIPSNSVWRFSDTNGNLGTGWRALNYVETGWGTGPAELGFGDGGEATVVNGGPSATRTPTIYFRHKFNVADTNAYANLFLGVLRDDGAVGYLNDVEVYRSNVPAGQSYSTYTGTTTTSETQYFPTNVSPARLVVGTNIMAVEVHQSDTGSSDLSFNLLLVGQAPPLLRAVRFGADLVLYWSDPAYQLESTAALPGGWTPVASAVTPWPITPTEAGRFYRLRKP
jgi:hypothetical protein